MTPEQIAAKLSDPMKAALLYAKPLNDGTFCHHLWTTTPTIKALKKRGLSDGFRILPLGLAVRDYLEKEARL